MCWSCDCHVTGALCFPAASVVLTLANLEGEETFDSSLLGQADEVVQERVCDDELILVKGYVGGETPEGAGCGMSRDCHMTGQCSWADSLVPSPLPLNGCHCSEYGLGNYTHIPGTVTSHSQNLEYPIRSSEIMALHNNRHDIIGLTRDYSSYLASHRPDSCALGHCGTTWALQYNKRPAPCTAATYVYIATRWSHEGV